MSAEPSPLTEVLPHVERLPYPQASWVIGRAFEKMNSALSWIWLALVGVVVVNVTLRYVFGEGRIELEETQWHLYAVGFLLGLSACMSADDHIRVDIFHERMSLRKQAWIELYGLILLFFPFVLMVLIFSIPFVEYSFTIGEVSDSPGGLPYRWAIKGSLTLAMLLLMVAGIGRLLRVTCCLFGSPVPRKADVGNDVD